MHFSADEIFKELCSSKRFGSAIRVKLKGRDEFITVVTEVLSELISVNNVSLHGNIIPLSIFRFSEIESAGCLNVHYNDPVYVKLRNIKASIRVIKEQRNLS